jgi:hypothetical protein
VYKMTDKLILSETWRWDKDTDELIDVSSEPPTRYPASSFDAKVAVYEARVREWFLDLAQSYVAGGQSRADYVALSIALAYIEGVEQYRQGRKTPKAQAGAWFKASAQRIFPAVSADAIDRLWKEARCGLFHCGFPEGRTYLSHDYRQAIAIKQGDLQIDPLRFIKAVVSDFTAYVKELRASHNEDLRRRFEKLWDYRWHNS